jgi:hypothetical protein
MKTSLPVGRSRDSDRLMLEAVDGATAAACPALRATGLVEAGRVATLAGEDLVLRMTTSQRMASSPESASPSRPVSSEQTTWTE